MSTLSRREDAFKIWLAGVRAVDSTQLVKNAVQMTGDALSVADATWRLIPGARICVVGAGKAGAGMAAGLEACFNKDWLSRTHGSVNVPADCVRPLAKIDLHPARPAGLNEPTEEGVLGTEEILRQVSELTQNDLCIVLISGGGSALLPAPIAGITLADKQHVTRTLMRSGATIQELNCVRRALSRIKGGGLLRACRAGTLIALIISDVIGDPLESIASGPTIDVQRTPEKAVAVLEKYGVRNFPDTVVDELLRQMTTSDTADRVTTIYSNHIIGNNSTAVAAATEQAKALGYQIALAESDQAGDADEEGASFARMCLQQEAEIENGERRCLISGGETTVHLVQTTGEQLGGRNQEFVLAAARPLRDAHSRGITILSGGTDGEDGPTDAAGAIVDFDFLTVAEQKHLKVEDYLAANNSYRYFETIGGLIKTGPTHTNVMDVRVGLIEQE